MPTPPPQIIKAMIIVTQDQLTALVRLEVEKVLTQMGQIQDTIPARKAWRLAGGRRRFETLCERGEIKPIEVEGYKQKRYKRCEVIRASQQRENNLKKIQL